MKNLPPTALGLVCLVLAISLVVMKRGDDAQQASDAGTIADFSNQLSSAQTQIAICGGTIAVFSNHLADCQSSALTFSNELIEAQATNAADVAQITTLSGQVAEMAGVKSENQALDARIEDLTNQVTALTNRIASEQASLAQANKDYGLLENRLRRDVAERVVVEREFNNLADVQAQLKKLRENPGGGIAAGDIYEGLGVEVSSNGSFYVLAPND